MSDNLTEAFNNLKKMVDSGNIPSEVQGLVNNLNNGNSDSRETLNNMLSQVSPEMLNNLSSMLQSNSSNNYSSSNNFNSSSASNYNHSSKSSSNNNNNLNIDPETLMKMTSLINTMNQKDNPGSNLLNSLKPYLRDSRKGKVDQYSNLLNLTKIAEVMKNEKKEKNNNA